MDPNEFAKQKQRLDRYIALTSQLGEVSASLYSLQRGPFHGSASPFTSNFREARKLQSVRIEFSATRGGEPAVSEAFTLCGIEAAPLGEWIQKRLLERQSAIKAEMEQL